MGELYIGSVNTSLTALPGGAELAGMTYKVHFSGPGGSFNREFGPSGGKERLQSGTWHVTVKAYTSEPRLRGISDQTLAISAGKNQIVNVTSCIGIQSDADMTLYRERVTFWYWKGTFP